MGLLYCYVKRFSLCKSFVDIVVNVNNTLMGNINIPVNILQYTLDDPDKIIAWAKQSKKKVVVIDDAGYIMTHMFMANHRIKKGNSQFDMYNDIADVMYNIVQRIKRELPSDVVVYIMMHEDMDDSGTTRLKTLGKLLDQKVCLEGMVTICIRCMSDANGRHFFRTVTDGTDITKTPEEMFEESEIENNLKLVDDTIREFYGWEKYKKSEDIKNETN